MFAAYLFSTANLGLHVAELQPRRHCADVGQLLPNRRALGTRVWWRPQGLAHRSLPSTVLSPTPSPDHGGLQRDHSQVGEG